MGLQALLTLALAASSSAAVLAACRWGPAAGLLLGAALAALTARRFAGITARALSEVEEMKDNFVNSVSHDMRSPLTAILGYVNMLLTDKDSTPSPLMAKGLGIIAGETRRMAALINDILDLNKLESRMMQLDLKTVDAAEVLRTAEGPAAEAAEKAGVRLESALPPGPLPVRADRELLRRALSNLLLNALKFTPKDGSVRLALRDLGSFAEVSVSDGGRPIPKDRLLDVFSRFQQTAPMREPLRKADVTDLGLALCREIVKAQGGAISAANAEDGGLLIRFTVPKADN